MAKQASPIETLHRTIAAKNRLIAEQKEIIERCHERLAFYDREIHWLRELAREKVAAREACDVEADRDTLQGTGAQGFAPDPRLLV